MSPERQRFPEAHGSSLSGMQEFYIGGRWLSLYAVKGRPESSMFSLYWNDTGEMVQHAMNYLEVLDVIAGLLAPAERS